MEADVHWGPKARCVFAVNPLSQSVFALATLKLRRTRFAQKVSGVAAPRVARLGEAWCGRWESNPHDVAIEGF